MSALTKYTFKNWDPMWSSFNLLFKELDQTLASDGIHLHTPTNKIELEVPGVKRESVKIKIEDRYVKINFIDRKGRKCSEAFYSGDATGADAKLEDGILTVTLKWPENKTSGIDVEVK